jgi:hypothetical protein
VEKKHKGKKKKNGKKEEEGQHRVVGTFGPL